MRALLIGVALIAIAAAAGPVIVGMNTFDGTVEEEPYEQGLAYDSVRKARETSGWHVDMANASFRVGRNDLIISLTDKDGRDLPDSSISLTISRPSSASYDRSYKTVREGDGRFRAATDLPLYGYWDVKIHVTSNGRSITFDRQIFAAQGEK